MTIAPTNPSPPQPAQPTQPAQPAQPTPLSWFQVVMDDLLTRTVALLERHADPAVDTRAVISRLLAGLPEPV